MKKGAERRTISPPFNFLATPWYKLNIYYSFSVKPFIFVFSHSVNDYVLI